MTDDPTERILRTEIGTKMGTARAILHACKIGILPAYNKNKAEIEKIIESIIVISIDTIRVYAVNLKDPIPFKTYIDKPNHICKLQYKWIRNLINKLYLRDQTVPTKDFIWNSITARAGYTLTDVANDLKGNGFIFKKLPNVDRALIVEDPRRIYKRMVYLNRMKMFRMMRKNFVYITFMDDRFSMAFSPLTELFSFMSETDGSESKKVYNFVEFLVQFIPPTSVLVIESKQLKANSSPNQYSSKENMRQWLNKHGIPYDLSAHTAELYALIQKFRNKFPETCEVREFLENNGFDVLWVPSEIPTLSYYNPIMNKMKDMPYVPEAMYMKSIFLNCCRKEVCSLEDTLKMEEIKVYNEELELDNVIDKICFMATQTVLQANDIKKIDYYEEEVNPWYIILD